MKTKNETIRGMTVILMAVILFATIFAIPVPAAHASETYSIESFPYDLDTQKHRREIIRERLRGAAMYSNFFCEDNAGDIFVFVYYRNDLINVIHLHGDESIEAVMDSCETGWPFADEYNPEDYGGLSMTAFLAELDIMGAEIIAEINGREPILYPEDMGEAGRKLFQSLIAERSAVV